MQSRDKNGIFGEVLKYNEKWLRSLLDKDGIEAVEVFKATDNEIKKHNKFRIGKRYKKVPKIKI